MVKTQKQQKSEIDLSSHALRHHFEWSEKQETIPTLDGKLFIT